MPSCLEHPLFEAGLPYGVPLAVEQHRVGRLADGIAGLALVQEDVVGELDVGLREVRPGGPELGLRAHPGGRFVRSFLGERRAGGGQKEAERNARERDEQ